MTFLNPAILFGLLAVAIPVLIHLFNLNKVRKVEFSTLMFLKELQRTRIRKIKLEQLILLALRVFAIIFLVLSFAKPVFRGYAGDKDLVRKTAVIIIDNSFSMSVSSGEGSYLESAKKISKDLLSNYSRSDEVYVLPSSFIGMRDRSAFTGDFGSLVDSIDATVISNKSLDIEQTVSEINGYIANSDNFINEFIIISDFQSRNFPGKNVETGSRENTRSVIYLIDINDRKPNNLAVENIELETKILLQGRVAKVKANLTNYSDFNVSNQNILFYVEDEFVSEKYIDAGSNSSTEFEFEFRPERTGSVNGRIELVNTVFNEDEIKADNKLYFSIFVPEAIDAGLINDIGVSYSFIKTALSSSIPAELEGSKITTSELSTGQITPGTKDLIILSGVNELSETESIRLRDYVENGGGLIIFTDRGVNVESYNSLLRNLNAPEIIAIVDDPAATLSVNTTDPGHPVLADIFNNDPEISTDIDSPKLNSYYKVIPSANNIVILELSNGDPFLIESSFGNGKVLLFTVAQGRTMSDFPLKNIFAPLVVRGAFYAASDVSANISYTIGKQNPVGIRGLTKIENVVLPDNREVSYGQFFTALDTFISSGVLLIPYNIYTAEQGVYTFTDSGGSFSVALNPESGEGDLSSPGNEAIAGVFSESGFDDVIYSDGNTFNIELMQQYRAGLELWWVFLFLALLCIAGEIFLSRKLQKG